MIDDHAHPFPLEYAPLELAELTLDVTSSAEDRARRAELAQSRLAVELLRGRLAKLLGCSPEDVTAVRNKWAQQDWAGWVAGLVADCGITGFLLDGVGQLDPAPYAELAGTPCWELMRVEPTVDTLMAEGASASEILSSVDTVISEAAARGAVGLKTVLAYRTGLGVDPDARLAEAETSLWDEDVPVRRRGKALRDMVFRRMLARAADFGLPIQVHSGYGDSDLRLAESNPLLLEDVLHTPEGSAATVVLIHGSFPWTDELAYLASVRPNVYAELSLSPLFSPARTADRLLRLLDTAPGARLLAGTDGHGPPETHWFAAHVLRDAVAEAGRELRAAGARQDWVDQLFDGFLEGNSRRVYALD